MASSPCTDCTLPEVPFVEKKKRQMVSNHTHWWFIALAFVLMGAEAAMQIAPEALESLHLPMWAKALLVFSTMAGAAAARWWMSRRGD